MILIDGILSDRNKRLLSILSLAFGLLTAPIILVKFVGVSPEFTLMVENHKGSILLAAAITGSAAVFLVSIINYLNKGVGVKELRYNDSVTYSELIKLRLQVRELQQKSSLNKSIDLSEDEKEKLFESAKKKIVGNTIKLADDSLKSEISSFKKQISLQKLHSDMVFRLENEIERLNRRGGVNLGIGTTIAFSGIVALGIFLYGAAEASASGGVDFFIHLLPKLSFVLIIELFAYFFLRLYKNGFEEVKYFQNEITNVEMKAMSLKFASDSKNESIIRDIALSLISTERNFILEKGQSTVLLEKEKMMAESDGKLTELLSELIRHRLK